MKIIVNLHLKILTVPPSKHSSSIKVGPPILNRELIAVCSEIHTKHRNTLCGQKTELCNIESFTYPIEAQLDCSKNVKIYMRGAPTCFGFSQPSSVSYCMCSAKVISINNQLKYVIYRICSV